MGLFNKNTCEVIKWDKPNANEILIHKFEEEDFNTMSQLIVHESQEAIFFMNGQALDLFGPGRFTLETQNIPLIGKFLKIPTGGKNPFHCEVYFINKTEQMTMKWGTDSKVQYIEPTYKFPVEIGVCGEMSIKVVDSRKLLVKVVGTKEELSQEEAKLMFKAVLQSKIKAYIANYLKNQAVSIFEIDTNLATFSEELKKELQPDFDEYGIELTRFFVTTVAKPETNEYREFEKTFYSQYTEITKARIEAEKEVIASEARAKARAQEGYTYQQERGFDVAQDVAQNEAKGQFTNLGVGLGTMAAVGGSVAGVVGNSINQAVNQTQTGAKFCPNCGKPVQAGAKFCIECGNKLI